MNYIQDLSSETCKRLATYDATQAAVSALSNSVSRLLKIICSVSQAQDQHAVFGKSIARQRRDCDAAVEVKLEKLNQQDHHELDVSGN